VTLQLFEGDCLDILPTLPAHLVDTIITDPPYGLTFMGKDWDKGVPGEAFWRAALRVAKPGAILMAFGGTRTYHRLTCAIEDAGWEIRDCMMWLTGQGFPKGHDIHKAMLKNVCSCRSSTLPYRHEKESSVVDNSSMRGVRGVLSEEDLQAGSNKESLLLVPVQRGTSGGGMEGARSQGACGMDGGIRTEFPPEVDGVEQSSMEGRGNVLQAEGQLQGYPVCESAGMGKADGPTGRVHHATPPSYGDNNGATVGANGSGASHRPRSDEQRSEQSGAMALKQRPQKGGVGERCDRCGKPLATTNIDSWQGWNVALKPAYEPIIVAQKPLDGTYAANAEKWGVAGLWIDGGRIGSGTEHHRTFQPTNNSRNVYGAQTGLQPTNAEGRWPANLILDDESAAALDAMSGERKGSTIGTKYKTPRYTGNAYNNGREGGGQKEFGYGDTGGASRFFYTAKASRAERGEGNHHPTVKPLALLRYLSRLTKTPTGGVVLDPFAGSGTTIAAALLEGRDAIGIELDHEYFEIMRRRVEAVEREIEAAADMPLQLALAGD
jgi:DNA modification methylase